jgi:hypothetical protein
VLAALGASLEGSGRNVEIMLSSARTTAQKAWQEYVENDRLEIHLVRSDVLRRGRAATEPDSASGLSL